MTLSWGLNASGEYVVNVVVEGDSCTLEFELTPDMAIAIGESFTAKGLKAKAAQEGQQ